MLHIEHSNNVATGYKLLSLLLLCLGAHAQARYTVVCLCVCLCVCVCRLLQLAAKDQRSASKGFYRLLVMFSWILIRGFAK